MTATLFLFLCLPPVPAVCAGSATISVDSAPLALESILKSVRQAEADIKDMSFSFRQKTALKGAGEPQEVVGKVIMTRKPERFRVDYESPVRQVAIYDGENIMLYMPETGQAFRQKAGRMDMKKMLGFDPSAPMGAFEGRYSPELAGCADGVCRISFKPGDPAGTAWKLAIDSGNWLLNEISFENSDMSMTITCTNYRLNTGLKAKAFKFILPPGTEVIDGIPILMGPGKAP